MTSEEGKQEANLSKNPNKVLEEQERLKEKEFVNLIAKIIVEITFQQAYEKGNSISEV